MKQLRNLIIPVLAGLMLCASNPVRGSAQGYPSRAITLIVPFPAGGVVDVIARRVADKLGASLGHRMVVDNRPGAGGMIGTATAARSEPDGYTLVLGGVATHVFPKSFHSNMSYDPVASFTPISQLTSGPLVLVVRSDHPAKNLSEFIAFLTEKRDAVNYASNGVGTFPHLSVELLKQAASVNPTHVPYKGGPDAILALLRGEVAFSINHIPNVLSQVNAGELRALATTDLKRSAAFPDIPTFDESGIKGFQASAWFGLFAPSGTPEHIVRKLEAETASALAAQDLRDQLTAMGDEPVGSTSKAFAAYLGSELAKWPPILAKAGIKAN